jgi:hypothetical protein
LTQPSPFVQNRASSNANKTVQSTRNGVTAVAAC